MKCKACGFDSDKAREEEAFLKVEPFVKGDFVATFPQHEAADVKEQVLIFACPKCGTMKLDSWRLPKED